VGASLDAIVVLGCRATLGPDGHLGPGVLARRVAAASRLYAVRAARVGVVVASGGRRWDEVVEADAIARDLTRDGVPPSLIVRERCSLSTWDNARFVAEALARRGMPLGMPRALVVTCDWHMPRALALFARAGVEAHAGAVALDPDSSPRRRLWRWGREALLGRAQGLRPGVPRAGTG
jgi:uncharacterized SAM-binding protein YcdF (DUF218 family)